MTTTQAGAAGIDNAYAYSSDEEKTAVLLKPMNQITKPVTLPAVKIYRLKIFKHKG